MELESKTCKQNQQARENHCETVSIVGGQHIKNVSELVENEVQICLGGAAPHLKKSQILDALTANTEIQQAVVTRMISEMSVQFIVAKKSSSSHRSSGSRKKEYWSFPAFNF